MFPHFISVSLLVVGSLSFEDPHRYLHWEGYKSIFNKTYQRCDEHVRKSAFFTNLQWILKHNEGVAKGRHNYTLRANHLADLPHNEYLLKMISLRPSHRRRIDTELLRAAHDDPSGIPEELDWREKGFKTGSWDQEACGSCYAFSVAASVQAQVFKKTGELVPLSPQQLVDCSIITGNMGCDGGSLRNTLHYVKSHGLMKAEEYPYNAKTNICKYRRHHPLYRIASWSILPARDEEALRLAVATIGPLPVGINVSPKTFQFYHEGVYDDPHCSSDSVNHAMLLVGYTKDAWILKNWWSDSWGMDGYMLLKRHKNRCGVANYAAYVTL